MAYRLGGDRSIQLSYSPVLIKIIAAVQPGKSGQNGSHPSKLYLYSRLKYKLDSWVDTGDRVCQTACSDCPAPVRRGDRPSTAHQEAIGRR